MEHVLSQVRPWYSEFSRVKDQNEENKGVLIKLNLFHFKGLFLVWDQAEVVLPGQKQGHLVDFGIMMEPRGSWRLGRHTATAGFAAQVFSLPPYLPTVPPIDQTQLEVSHPRNMKMQPAEVTPLQYRVGWQKSEDWRWPVSRWYCVRSLRIV